MNLVLLPLIFFAYVTNFGAVGLYQHNFEPFYEIQEGDHLYYYDDYTVVTVLRLERMQDNNYSDYKGYGLHMDYLETFELIYTHPGTLVLQTCDKNTWGTTIFIIAAKTERIGL